MRTRQLLSMLALISAACATPHPAERSMASRYSTLQEAFPNATYEVVAVPTPSPASPEDQLADPYYPDPQNAYRNRYLPGCSIEMDSTAAPPEKKRKPLENHGSLSKAAIGAAVETFLHEARSCYLVALRGWPTLEGKATLTFRITPEGTVDAVDVVRETTVEPALACCVAEVVRKWKFPTPEGGGFIVVTYPWVFALRPGAEQSPKP